MEVSSRTRGALLLALIAYSAVLAVALLAPASGTQSSMASWVVDLARAVKVPERLATQARSEFLCNAVIIAPVAALGSLVWPRTTWRDWTAWAFVISGCIELVQGLLLPARTASMTDVVANTLGGLGGAVVVVVGRRLSARQSQVPRSDPSAE